MPGVKEVALIYGMRSLFKVRAIEFFSTKYTKIIAKGRCFFRDYAREKWFLRGLKQAENLN